MLYPIAISLVLLNVGNVIFKRDPKIFRPCLILTTFFAIFDGLKAAGINTGAINTLLEAYMPLYNIGFGWIAPCLIGIIIGFIWKAFSKN